MARYWPKLRIFLTQLYLAPIVTGVSLELNNGALAKKKLDCCCYQTEKMFGDIFSCLYTIHESDRDRRTPADDFYRAYA